MKFGNTLIALCAVALLGALGWLWLAPAGPQNSPDITLLTIDGEALPLASLRGKPLLVTFWATTCPGCIKEMPELIKLYKDLAPQGLEMVGVAMSYDRPSDVVYMRKARKIPYPVALDIHGTAAQAFGNVSLIPASFLIAPDGKIVSRNIGALDMTKLRQNILTLLKQTRITGHQEGAKSS